MAPIHADYCRIWVMRSPGIAAIVALASTVCDFSFRTSAEVDCNGDDVGLLQVHTHFKPGDWKSKSDREDGELQVGGAPDIAWWNTASPFLSGTKRAMERIVTESENAAVKHKYVIPLACMCTFFLAIVLLRGSQTVSVQVLEWLSGKEAKSIQEEADEKIGKTASGKLEDVAEEEEEAQEQVDVSQQALPEAEAKVEEPLPFVLLFRFASVFDLMGLIFALTLSFLHGLTMCWAFSLIGDAFQTLQMPNDDGTLPPTPGPNSLRTEACHELAKKFCFLAIFALTARTIAWISAASIAEHQLVSMRRSLYSKLLYLGPGWYDTHSAADMAVQLSNDTYQFRQGIGEELVDMFRSLAIGIGTIILTFYANWRAAVIFCAVLPIAGMAFTDASRVQAEKFSRAKEVYGTAGAIAQAALSSSRTVAAFNGQERASAAYGKAVRLAEACGVLMHAQGGIDNGVVYLAVFPALALSLFIISNQALEDYHNKCWSSDPPYGSCPSGSSLIAAFLVMMLGVAKGLTSIPPCLERVALSRSAAKRIYQVLDRETGPSSGKRTMHESEVKGSITFEDVSFAYPSRPDVLALRTVSFDIAAGSTVAFVGFSGSGKSTLLSLLLRFYEPKDGRVLFEGIDVRSFRLPWLRSKLALVEQEPVLFSGTLLENITWGRPSTVEPEEVVRAAELANAHEFIMDKADQYQTNVGERGVQLSGGEKQRIAIARALLRDPAVLLLDEATSALDARNERVVQSTLDELMQERAGAMTVVIIAHRLSTIKAAKEVFVMEEGTILERGALATLAANPKSAYSKLVALQSSASERVVESKTTIAEPSGEPQPELAEIHEPEVSQSVLSQAESVEDGLGSASRALMEGKKGAVPLARLWEYGWQDAFWYGMGAISALIYAFSPPVGMIFLAESLHLLDLPPVGHPSYGSQQWVPIYDESKIRLEVSRAALLLVALAGSSAMSFVGQQIGFGKAGEAITRRLREATFRAMLRQEIEWFDANSSGVLADRLATDAPQVKTLTGNNLAAIVALGSSTLVGGGFAFFISWRLTSCVIGLLVLLGVGILAAQMFAKRTNVDNSVGIVLESLTSMRTVASNGMEPRLLKTYTSIVEEQSDATLRASFILAFSQGAAACGAILLLAALVYFANLFICNGQLMPNRASVVLLCLLFVVFGLQQSTDYLGDKEVAMQAATRLMDIIDRVPQIDALAQTGGRPARMYGKVEFRNVTFCYVSRPDQLVLRGFDLTVKSGKTAALVGSSGCGKSSSVGLIVRFYDPQLGLIAVDGVDVRKLNIKWLRQHIGLVQQEPVLFAGTIAENIKYGNELAKQAQIEAAARSSDADSFVSRLQEGYQTQAGGRGSQLSGGQKQRIAIARALVREPTILLLDEATSALDPAAERSVMDALAQLSSRRLMTTIVVAHRLSTIQDADPICVVEGGRIVEQGTHEELSKIRDGKYKKLISLQQGDAR